MMFATKIHMNSGCEKSNCLPDIHSIYVIGYGEEKFYTKEEIYDYLKAHPHSIKVDIYPYSFIIPTVSPKGEKFVRSIPNDSGDDNLLELPRE